MLFLEIIEFLGFMTMIAILLAYMLLYSKRHSEYKKLSTVYEKEKALITNIITTLQTSIELKEILKRSLDFLSAHLGHKNVFIYLIDPYSKPEYLKCIAYPGAISINGVDRLNIHLDEKEMLQVKRVKDDIAVMESINRKISSILSLNRFEIFHITIRNRVIGAIIVEVREPNKFRRTELEIFANQIGFAIENALLYEKTRELTIIDELTELYNYRYFRKKLKEEIKVCKRYKDVLSLALIDIDDFKHYNDRNGHLAGNECLKIIAEILKREVFSVDTVARYGGEEFVVIMPATPKENSIIAGKKLVEAVSKYHFPYGENQPLKKVTVSIGLATYPDDAVDDESLIKCADMALYEAKRSGKNRVCIYSPMCKGSMPTFSLLTLAKFLCT